MRLFPWALGACVGMIFAGEYTPKVQVKPLLKSTVNSIGQSFSFPAGAEVHGIEVMIPPGVSTGWHKHPHSGFAYVLTGQLRVNLRDGKSFDYAPGQAFAEVVETEHEGIAGADTVRLAVFFFSAPGEPFTIKTP
jgi:quercetin dioxygenase-like cupin family protein